MKNLQKINDKAIKGGWAWKYEPSDYNDVAFAHYMSPLLEVSFWQAVCITQGRKPEEAKKLMMFFIDFLFEKGNVDDALGEIIKLN